MMPNEVRLGKRVAYEQPLKHPGVKRGGRGEG